MNKAQFSDFMSAFAEGMVDVDTSFAALCGDGSGKSPKAVARLQAYKKNKAEADRRWWKIVTKEDAINEEALINAMSFGKRKPAKPPTRESRTAQGGICLCPLWELLKITREG